MPRYHIVKSKKDNSSGPPKIKRWLKCQRYLGHMYRVGIFLRNTNWNKSDDITENYKYWHQSNAVLNMWKYRLYFLRNNYFLREIVVSFCNFACKIFVFLSHILAKETVKETFLNFLDLKKFSLCAIKCNKQNFYSRQKHVI